jgi:Ca-activated chloride channel family protein
MRTILVAAIALLGATSPRAPQIATRALVVRGTVTDRATSRPVEQAQVVVVGTMYGALTNGAGEYSLNIQVGARDSSLTLVARRVGYVLDRRTVAVGRDTVRADFTLSAALVQLSEVVTTASGAPLYGSVAGSAVARLSIRAPASSPAAPDPDRPLDRERYARIDDNAFLSVASAPLSTFSVDVDRASYANVRRYVSAMHQRPPKDAVRIEELINYFPYDYADPMGEHPIAVQRGRTGAVESAAPRGPHRCAGQTRLGRQNTAEQSRVFDRCFGIDADAEQAAARSTTC